VARPLRIVYPGAFYHITSRGNERKDIFESQGDRERNTAGQATSIMSARKSRPAGWSQILSLAILAKRIQKPKEDTVLLLKP
jgi:REP element-mobilizing transposase RayT